MAPDDLELDSVLRHIIVGDYRALFTVRGRVVFVLNVRHGSRQSATSADLASALRELRSQVGDTDQ